MQSIVLNCLKNNLYFQTNDTAFDPVYVSYFFSRNSLLEKTVLFNVLEDKGTSNHIEANKNNDTNLGEHKCEENLNKLSE